MNTYTEQWLLATKAALEFHNKMNSKRYRLVLKALSTLKRGGELDNRLVDDLNRHVRGEKTGIYVEFADKVAER